MSALLQAQNGANPASFACAREDGSAFSTSAEALQAPVQQAATPASIRLVLPYPISANRYWATRVITPKGHRRAMAITYVTTDAEAYKQDVQRLALLAGVRKPLRGRVQLIVRLFPNRPLDYAKRARKDPDGWSDTVQCIDLDNALKVLLDALKNIAFGDDAWVRKIDAERMEPDERGPRVEVVIAPIMRQAIAPELF